jgi:hypothetical protein
LRVVAGAGVGDCVVVFERKVLAELDSFET